MIKNVSTLVTSFTNQAPQNTLLEGMSLAIIPQIASIVHYVVPRQIGRDPIMSSTLPNNSNHNVGPLHRPSILESFYIPFSSVPLSTFKGYLGFQIGNFQHPMVRPVNPEDAKPRTSSQNTFNTGINQNGRVHNNPVLDQEFMGLGSNRRPYNEPLRWQKTCPNHKCCL